jgi:hypothetical protein
VATEVGQHAVAQPFDDGVLRPEVVQLGPGVLLGAGLAGGFDGVGHALGVGAQSVVVVVGLGFARQLAQAVLQVERRGERDDALGILSGPLAQGLALVEQGQRGLGVVEVAVEERGGLGDVVEAAAGGGRRLCVGGAVAAEEVISQSPSLSESR